MGFCKHVVRYGVVAGLVGGTAALVAGPDRVGALFTQTRNCINAEIDEHIDDPVALRSQMRKLAGQYPERISAVERDLAELRAQTSQLRQEREVSERVVELASGDLDQIRGLIGRAETAQAAESASGGASIVRVVFNDESFDVDGAYSKARSIQQVQDAYVQRAADIDRDLGYLSQQESRLAQLHEQLRREYTDFQAQMWQMDRQVDTIARNDRLIAVMEKRQRTLDEQSRYQADSLGQLASRFADIRAKQESRLETLSTSTNINSYEDRAKVQLDVQRSYRGMTGQKPVTPVRPSVIEITPQDLGTPEPAKADSKPIAMVR